LYNFTLFVIRNLPRRCSYFISNIIADICCRLDKKKSMAICKNLEKILGRQINRSESKKMTRDIYRNYAKNIADFFRFDRANQEFFSKNLTTIGRHHIDGAIEKGKGAIVISGHIGAVRFGCVDLGAAVNLLSAPNLNEKVNKFIKKQRSKIGIKTIELQQVKNCFKVLKSGEILAVAIDRDVKQNGFSIDFFGEKKRIPKGPAVLSYRLGAPIIPLFCIRQPDDTFLRVLEEPIYPDRTKPEDEAIFELAEKSIRKVESYYKKYPTNCFMFNDLWDEGEFVNNLVQII